MTIKKISTFTWFFSNAYAIGNFLIAPMFIAAAFWLNLDPKVNHDLAHNIIGVVAGFLGLGLFPFLRKEAVKHYALCIKEDTLHKAKLKITKWYLKAN